MTPAAHPAVVAVLAFYALFAVTGLLAWVTGRYGRKGQLK
jgi:hypothetical protein